MSKQADVQQLIAPALVTKDVSDNECTEICSRLRNLTLTNGRLPAYGELVAQLAFERDARKEDELQDGVALGTIQELRDRKDCPVCQLVLSVMTESKDEGLPCPPEQVVQLLLFPGEQSLRLSFPSRLGTRLVFVAEDNSQVSGPDSARRLRDTQINSTSVLSWLEKCEKHHGATCYPQLDAKTVHDQVAVFAASRGRRRLDFNERATSNFRVIDLELECIVPQTLDARYVTLSYVWGQLPMFRLLKDNLDELGREGGLKVVVAHLPRTILDAMEFVKSLRIRFLWVDALCLVQDDENDMEIGIELMNSVYQGSYFPIIAASGTDATAGLPGVRPGSRAASQPIVKLNPSGNGLKMTVQHSIDWHLKRSVYNQRGWTLQELVLPRRSVIFIHDRVYFRCQEANWAEDTTADAFTHYLDLDDSNISRIPDPLEGRLRSWWAYQKLLEEYSTREIRFDGDALRATAGILRPLCAGMETRMLEGLPDHYLDNAVLFMSSRGDLRRRPGFASFSWAGWAGSVMWPRENYLWHDNGGRRKWDTSNLFRWFAGETFINWTYISCAGHQNSLMDDPYGYEAPSRLSVLVDGLIRQYPHLRAALASFNGGRYPEYPKRYTTGGGSGPFHENWSLDRKKKTWSHAAFDLANSQNEFDRLVRNLNSSKHRLEYSALFNWVASRRAHTRQTASRDNGKQVPSSIGRYHDRVHYRFRHDDELSGPRMDPRKENAGRWRKENSDLDGPIAKFPPYAVLSFQTLSISLILGETPDASTGLPCPRDWKTASSFHRIPGIPLLSSSSEMVGSLHPDNLEQLLTPGTIVECILMSHCQALTWSSALDPQAETVSMSDFDEAEVMKKEVPHDLFWALYIIWKDGIAERQGVAQVLSTAVGSSCAPGPVIKDVLLG